MKIHQKIKKTEEKMNISKLLRIVCISIIMTIMVLSGISFSYATTSSELKRQQQNIDKQIDKTNSEIAGVKNQMSANLNQINKLNAEISTYENEITNLETKIGSLNNDISAKELSIQEQEQKYAVQKDLLDKRLVALYESGSTSYLDMLLSADGLTEFISKYYTIEQLAEADEELLAKIESTKKQIEDEKNSLQNAKTEVENSKTAVVGKRNSLASSRNEKTNIVNQLSAEEAALQEQLEEFEKDKKEIQRELAALAAKSSVKDAVAPSAAGYISPLAGKTKGSITTGYYGYAGHTGVDFACGSGTPIRAVKAGTVVTSKALRRPNGQYKSYGEYIVIDHNDGTMTLYAHMSSRAVGPGATVAQGQTIGYVGSTGNSTGPHLHFEVRVKGSCVNPTPYLP